MPVSKKEARRLFDFFREYLEGRVFRGPDNVYYKLSVGWRLEFDMYRLRAGVCYGDGSKRISLSIFYLNSPVVGPYDVAETILHELAHAMVGTYNGHNHIWKCVAQQIGSYGEEFCRKIFNPYKYAVICHKGCMHGRHQLVRKTYTGGKARCPRHRNIPAIAVRVSDLKVIF